MDVEPSPSPTTNVSLQLPTGPPAPLSNELMPPTSIETSTNPSQLTTTTANTLPSSTPSAPTASVSCSVLPQSSPAQTTAVNPPPSPTTTGAAPITPRNVSTHAPLGKVAPPPTSLSNAIRDIIIGMKDLEGPLPPTLTAAGARRSDQPPACSASVTPMVCQNAASQIQPSHDQVRMLSFWLGYVG